MGKKKNYIKFGHKLLLFAKNNEICHCTGNTGRKRGNSMIPQCFHGTMRLLLFKIAIHGAERLWKKVRKVIIVKRWGSDKLGGNNFPISAHEFAVFLENWRIFQSLFWYNVSRKVCNKILLDSSLNTD